MLSYVHSNFEAIQGNSAIETITMNTTQTTPRRHSITVDSDSITTSMKKLLHSLDEHRSQEAETQSPSLSSPLPWVIEDEDVATIPDIYPKMISPLLIRDTTDVCLIGRRLSDFLTANSVRSVYDKQRGRVFCSSANTSFVVQFWRRSTRRQTEAQQGHGAGDYNNDEGGKQRQQRQSCGEEIVDEIVLEIRRRSGCGYGLHKIRNALRRSIESKASRKGRIVTCEGLLSSQRQLYRPSLNIKNQMRTMASSTIRRRQSSPPGDFLS